MRGNGGNAGSCVLSAENDWTYMWKDMPMNEGGYPISYRLMEYDVEGYTTVCQPVGYDADTATWIYPFISFDTLYEEGKYVIFSVGVVSTEESDSHYLDFFALNSRRVDERQRAIETLQSVSVYGNAIDVRLEDQILLLVTCVGKDSDRRIVAARRIRDGEDQKALKELAEQSWKK